MTSSGLSKEQVESWSTVEDIPVKCIQCGKTFLISESEEMMAEPKICSEECARK